jgi:hypothetical protein
VASVVVCADAAVGLGLAVGAAVGIAGAAVGIAGAVYPPPPHATIPKAQMAMRED